MSHSSSDSEDSYDSGTNDPKLFSQSDLNDLIRDLGLPKDSAEVLGLRLKERHTLAAGTSFSWYRFREKVFVPLLHKRVTWFSAIMYVELWTCSKSCMNQRNGDFSSKSSLKAVIFHNGNQYASVPVEHSVHLKECYKNIDFVLKTLGYPDHKWTNCRNLQVISMLLGQQIGCTMFLCFL